jgi:rubrerythrin
MTNEYLNFIVFLENTMATYYQKIKNLPRLEGARQVLEFMEQHSFEHAAIIEKTKKDYPKPSVRESLVADFQNNLLNKVYRQISEEKDILKVLESLAVSEESVGKLYQSLAGLLAKTAEHYTEVAARINEIAEQEFQHRDLLLKDRARLAEKAAPKK